MSTQKARMRAGSLYDPADVELVADRRRARTLCQAFNHAAADDADLRRALLAELLGRASDVFIEPPFRCDYGFHISVGQRVCFNFDCVVLDVMPVTIGSNVLFGPGVHVYTATHPVDAATRAAGLEYARAITIADDVWIGGRAVIGPGVSIGARTVIGAGSVVTRDIPADVVAAGNPCRVLRPATADDRAA